MLSDELKQLGLGKNEADVYISLQELGKSKAGEMIEKTGLHRNLVYQSLKSLEEKGLLTKLIGGGATIFQANDPSELLHLVKRQESVAERIVRELQSRAKIMKQKVTLYEGNAGFRAAFWDSIRTLKPGEELLIMGIFDIDEEFQGMIKTFHEERAAAGIPSRILLNAHAKHVGDMLDRIDMTDIQYMQPGMVTPSVFFVYAGKTMISLPNQRTFIIIENEEATRAFRSYFNTLWDKTSQTFKGEEGVRSFLKLALGVGEPIHLIGAHFKFREFFPELYNEWHAQRAQKNIFMKATIPESVVSSRPFGDISKIEVRSVETSAFPNVIWVFGDYVANALWVSPEETTIFLIHNSVVAQQYRDYFNDFWQRGKKIA